MHKLSSNEYPEHMLTTTTANPAVVPEPVQPADADVDPGQRFAHGTEQCQFPDCTVIKIFRDRDAYAQHLKKVHRVSDDDFSLYMSRPDHYLHCHTMQKAWMQVSLHL